MQAECIAGFERKEGVVVVRRVDWLRLAGKGRAAVGADSPGTVEVRLTADGAAPDFTRGGMEVQVRGVEEILVGGTAALEKRGYESAECVLVLLRGVGDCIEVVAKVGRWIVTSLGAAELLEVAEDADA